MFPIVLNPEYVKLILIGNESLTQKRLKGLKDAGITHIDIFSPAPCHCMGELNAEMKSLGARIHKRLPRKSELKSAHIVYIVDIEEKAAIKLADYCRKKNILVNIEDVIPYCDFHTPSIVRRGDLLFSISTKGKSPTLAIRAKKYISNKFPPEWAERLEILAQKRQKWRSEGLSGKQVMKQSDEFIDKEGWLSDE